VGDLEVRASFGLNYFGRAEAEQHAFRMLGLLPADFPAWNLAALTATDADDAEELLEQLVDAVLVDVAGVDATGLIRYLLRAFARECLAEAEPPGVREDSLARLADQYIAAARLASALVHPGTSDPEGAPASRLPAEDVVRSDPWGGSWPNGPRCWHAAWPWILRCELISLGRLRRCSSSWTGRKSPAPSKRGLLRCAA
jgi:hypothetical protein